MRPSQVSSALRQIATKITNSKNPRRDLVFKDLEFVLSKLATSDSDSDSDSIGEEHTKNKLAEEIKSES